MEDKLVEIKSPIQLLVEGNDGRNFFEAFRKHLAISECEMQIRNYCSITNLGNFLDAFTVASNFSKIQRIGIIRDAERSATGAFQSVQSALRNVGLPVPGRPGIHGVNDSPYTAALILPEQDSGMLETVLNKSFAGTPVDACIDGFLDCIESTAGGAIHRPDKARANAYLSSTPEPHVSVGFAAKKGYWALDHEAFDSIRDFMQSLCAA